MKQIENERMNVTNIFMLSLSINKLLFVKLVFSLALKANIIYNVVYISSGWVFTLFSFQLFLKVFESIKRVVLNNISCKLTNLVIRFPVITHPVLLRS